MGVLRTLLAVAVVVTHAGQVFGLPMLPGNYAVEVFFVISGFYMSMVLQRKYRGQNAARVFYINRWLRLYPTYIITVIATWVWFVVGWAWLGRMPTNSWSDAYAEMDLGPKLALIASNWTMLGNEVRCLFHWTPDRGFLLFHEYSTTTAADGAVWAGDFGTIGQAWSLGVELWFYLLAPCLCRMRSRYLSILLVASATVKVYLEIHGVMTYFFFPAQICFFLSGILVQRHSFDAAWSAVGRLPKVAALIMLCLWIMWFDAVPFVGERWAFDAFTLVVLAPVFSLSRHSEFDRWLGSLSYPIYLTHMLVMSVCANALKVASAPVVLVGTVSVAVMLVKLVDEPVDAWRQRRVAAALV